MTTTSTVPPDHQPEVWFCVAAPKPVAATPPAPPLKAPRAENGPPPAPLVAPPNDELPPLPNNPGKTGPCSGYTI